MTWAFGERSSTEPTPDKTATLKPACDASAILRSALVSPTCDRPALDHHAPDSINVNQTKQHRHAIRSSSSSRKRHTHHHGALRRHSELLANVNDVVGRGFRHVAGVVTADHRV
jgi:hypothetical protein